MAQRWLVTTPAGVVGIFKTAKAAKKWLTTGFSMPREIQTRQDQKSEILLVNEQTPVFITEIEFDE